MKATASNSMGGLHPKHVARLEVKLIVSNDAGPRPVLRRHPVPETLSDLAKLDAPIVRLRQDQGPCLILGKVIDWSPLYFIIADAALGQITTQKVKKSRVHIEPCAHCPGIVQPYNSV